MSGMIPLVPKNPDGVLRVLMIGRVSTIHQNVSNIDAGYNYAEDILKTRYGYQGLMEVKHFGERGSGMRTDRATIMEAAEEIASGKWDIVLMEDISKPYRNPRWIYAFVQDAVDECVRVIAPGDALDSADDNWEVNLGAAALRHGLHIPDTRRRVRRTATYSFHGGGMVQKARFGYRKLTKEEAQSGNFGPKDLRIAKLPECTSIIREMKDRVMAGAFYRAIADWLNGEEIRPGHYVTMGKWTGRLVIDYLRNPILSGTRTFRDVIHDPIFRTGKHRRRKNPKPETEYYPELAHLTREEHAALLRVMDERAAQQSGPAPGPNHPLSNKPRARVLWPAQHLRCAICGGRMYQYDNCLQCCNAHGRGDKACWNHVQVSVRQIRAKAVAVLFQHCSQVPKFRETIVDAAWREWQRQRQQSHRSQVVTDQEIKQLEKEAENLARAIAKGGELEWLVSELKRVDAALQAARKRQTQELKNAVVQHQIGSREEIEARLESALRELVNTSYDFAVLMRRMIPEFVIQPVQTVDGYVRPRGKLTISPAAFADPMAGRGVYVPQPGDVSLVLDLFDSPGYILHMDACLAEKAKNRRLSVKKIGLSLGINFMIVKRAFDYARRMRDKGWLAPYKELTARPESVPRWKQRR
jgi:site-specific DNA recombinase